MAGVDYNENRPTQRARLEDPGRVREGQWTKRSPTISSHSEWIRNRVPVKKCISDESFEQDQRHRQATRSGQRCLWVSWSFELVLSPPDSWSSLDDEDGDARGEDRGSDELTADCVHGDHLLS